MSHLLKLYENLFWRISCGNSKGKKVNAKPIYLISLIEAVPLLDENKIFFDNDIIRKFYKQNLSFYESEFSTPIFKPFYYCGSESFYELVWNKNGYIDPKKVSPKSIKDNISYAKFDDDLWELLQDSENREYLKHVLIKEFIEP